MRFSRAIWSLAALLTSVVLTNVAKTAGNRAAGHVHPTQFQAFEGVQATIVHPRGHVRGIFADRGEAFGDVRSGWRCPSLDLLAHDLVEQGGLLQYSGDGRDAVVVVMRDFIQQH